MTARHPIRSLSMTFGLIAATLLTTSIAPGGTTPTNLWQIRLDGAIHGSPTVSPNGTVYVGTAQVRPDSSGNTLVSGKFYSLSSAGATNWMLDLVGACMGTAALGEDGTIHVGVLMNSGNYPTPLNKLYAINPDGSIKWSLSIKGTMQSSPALGADGTVYFQASSQLHSISSKGTPNWMLPLATGGAGYPARESPSIGPDGTVYLGGRLLHAVNPSGQLKWTFKPGLEIYPSPAFGQDGTIYFGCDDGHLYALHPDGTERWRFQAPDWGCDASPVLGPDGSVYFATLHSGLYSVSSQGQSNWFVAHSGLGTMAPVVASNGRVYYANLRELYEIQPGGRVRTILSLKNEATESEVFTAPPVITPDGVIYVGASDGPAVGTLYAIRVGAGTAESAWPMDRGNAGHTARASSKALLLQSAPGGISLTLMVEPAQTYALDSSVNLESWSEILRFTPKTSSLQLGYPSHGEQRFYRLRLGQESSKN